MKKLVSIVLILFLIVVNSHSQNACFTTEKKTYCIGEPIKIIDCSGYNGSGQAPQYDFDINDGIPDYPPGSFVQTYTKAGYYKIEQIYKPPGQNLQHDTQEIHVLPTLPPTFDVLICQGLQVTVKITDEYEGRYFIDFGDGTIPDTVLKNGTALHTYADSLNKTITVTGGCGSPNKKIITPFNYLKKPDVLSLQLTNTTGILTFDAVPYLKYKILEKPANSAIYVPIDTVLKKSGIINLPYLLNSPGNKTCYKIVTFDDCGHEITSETTCTDTISVSAQNNQNSISWLPYTGSDFSQYILFKNGVQLVSFPNVTDITLVDIGVLCGKNYCYKIVTELTSKNLFNNQPVKSISDSTCVVGVSNNIPPTVQQVTSTIEGNSVKINWNNNGVTVKKYYILRSDQTNPFISTSTTTPYFDDRLNVGAESYCYSIKYDNECANTSAYSLNTCPVLLKVDQPDEQTNNLSWTTYDNQPAGVVYTVEKLDNNNNVIFSSAVNSLTFTDGPIDASVIVNRYRIKAEYNGFTSYSNIVEVRNDIQIYVPNAFTPNGTGPQANEIFKIYGRGIKEFEIKIFNRWGEMVYYSTEFDVGWDGYYKGTLAKTDAYAYLIQAKDKSGNLVTKKGTVTLLR